MYCLYLLAIFLFFGVDGSQPTDQNTEKNDSKSFQTPLQSPQNFSYFLADLTITGKQSRDLENALNGVARKFLGRHVAQLSLRNTENKNASLSRNVRIMGDAICEEIQRLGQRFGLARRTKFEFSNRRSPNEPDLNSVLYYYLLRVPLTLFPIFQQARSKINDHFRKAQYTKMGYKSSRFALQMNYGTSTDQLAISAFFASLSMLGSSASDCLGNASTSTSFDLKKAIANLTNSSPETAAKKLKSRLAKWIPKCPVKNVNEIQAFMCHALTEDSRLEFRHCLDELKRLEKCIKDKLNKTSKFAESPPENSRDFLRTIKGIDDSCKNADQGMEAVVGCKLQSKAVRNNPFPAMIDFFRRDSNKSPEIRRLAMKVGLIIAKNPACLKAVREIMALIKFWEESEKKQGELMKAAQRDVRQRSIFTSITNVLTDYRKRISDVTYRTVAHVRNVVSTVQRLLVDTASTFLGEDLSANVQALKSLSQFSTTYINGRPNIGGMGMAPLHRIFHWWDPQPVRQRHRDINRGFPMMLASGKAGSIKSSHGEALDKLIVSMKHLGQPSKPRRSIALVSIANTFLLATMFYECLSLLAGAMYYGDSNSVSPSNDAEAEEVDHWQSSRDRRSTAPFDREDVQPPRPMEQQKPFPVFHEPEKTTTIAIAIPDHEENDQESGGYHSDERIPEEIHTIEHGDQHDSG